MSAAVSMRDALYEAPGPKTRRRVAIGTAISLVALAALVAFVIRQFYINDQLNPRYWSFFARWTTWRFLLRGFLGTIRVALVAGILAMGLGLLLMLGRISSSKVLSGICHVITDLFRSLPSLLLIYFFFLVIPKYGLKMPSFWMITIPVALAASGVLAEVFRAGVNAVPKGQTEAAMSLGMTHGSCRTRACSSPTTMRSSRCTSSSRSSTSPSTTPPTGSRSTSRTDPVRRSSRAPKRTPYKEEHP